MIGRLIDWSARNVMLVLIATVFAAEGVPQASDTGASIVSPGKRFGLHPGSLSSTGLSV